MLNERDWRRRNRDRDEEKKKKEKKEFWWENGNDPRTREESTFYTNTIKDGTIKQEKPDKPDIPTIKENIETAEKKVNQLKNEQFDLMAAGGRDDQIYTAKKNVENAQKEVEYYNLQLTEAYGLGPNGYWNNKNPMNEEDRTVHGAGQKPTTSVQPAITPTVTTKPITRPKTVTELDNWVNNPEGYRPLTATATKPKATSPVTPRKRVTRVPTTHLDMDIAQMQDELVNNPNKSEQKKWGIEDKITKLSADRDVLNWRRSRTTPPSVEDFEAKKGYIEQQKQFNQDAIVNGLGNGTLKVGSDEWYALQKKGDKLQEQIDAYNRGMMGVLDGEKAVTREEQAQNQPGINNANSTVGREQIQPGINNANSVVGREPIQPGINNVNSMIGDGGVKDPMAEHMYAIGTGGVTGNYKPPELRELEQAVSSYEVALVNIANETRINDVDKIIIEVLRLKNAGTPLDEKSAWGSAVKKLNELEQTTGYTYYEALIKLGREQKNFEEYQRVEEIKANATYRISEELEENPEFVLSGWNVDWESEGVAELEDIKQEINDLTTLNQYLSIKDSEGVSNAEKRLKFLTEFENVDESILMTNTTDTEKIGSRLFELTLRKNDLEDFREDVDIALKGNIEDMNLKQLFIRAEHDYGDMIKPYEQGVIKDGLEFFNGALLQWEEGDDTIIAHIVKEVYGGTKHLKNVDLNELRNDYIKYEWKAEQFDELFSPYKYIGEEIAPYFKEKSNYKDTWNGYQFEMPSDFAKYLITYAENEETRYQNLETGADLAGIATGAIPKAGVVFSIIFSTISNKQDYNEDIWDDLILKLEEYNVTDKTLIIKVYDKKPGNPDVDISKKEN